MDMRMAARRNRTRGATEALRSPPVAFNEDAMEIEERFEGSVDIGHGNGGGY